MTALHRRDARSLDHDTLEEMRRLAVRRVLGGESQVDVAAGLEVLTTTVWKWMDAYRKGGAQALASTKASGPAPKLSSKQRKELSRIIVGKHPDQLNFGCALWTLHVVRQLIDRRFGVVLHESTVSRMLRRMGLSPQRPVRRAFQRDDAECRRWATEVFPGIVREAKRKQASLLFADETGVHEDGPTGTTWGARGQTPVVRVSGRRARINVISFISPGGRFWFRCYKEKLNAALFIEFLKALLHDIKGQIVMVLDKHPAHIAAATARFIRENRKRLSVHFLPSYAPDMNPDEHVWGYLKGRFRQVPMDETETLPDAVARAMTFIAEDRSLLRSFFEHPEVAYVKEALNW